MHVDDQQILSLSRELWASQLGLTIDSTEQVEAAGDERTFSSCINVSGPWQGTILLERPESIARHAAVMLFSTDGDETSDEDIHDALKELAAMIGKRMRSVLPESAKLSRPSIVSDPTAIEKLQGLNDLRMSCEGRPIRIALLEKASETAPA